jgi:hypothetical protein
MRERITAFLEHPSLISRLAVFNIVFVAACIFIPGIFGNPTLLLDEWGPVTILSGLQLGAAGFMAQHIRNLRLGRPLIWALIAWGFYYLALDEMLQFHESWDKVIHWVLGIQQTSLTDRIDDALVGLYGLVGLGAMWFGRAELRAFFRRWPLFTTGFICLVIYVGFDVLTNDGAILSRYLPALANERAFLWLEAAEDSFKILGEFLFVVALRKCWDDAKAFSGIPR